MLSLQLRWSVLKVEKNMKNPSSLTSYNNKLCFKDFIFKKLCAAIFFYVENEPDEE